MNGQPTGRFRPRHDIWNDSCISNQLLHKWAIPPWLQGLSTLLLPRRSSLCSVALQQLLAGYQEGLGRDWGASPDPGVTQQLLGRRSFLWVALEKRLDECLDFVGEVDASRPAETARKKISDLWFEVSLCKVWAQDTTSCLQLEASQRFGVQDLHSLQDISNFGCSFKVYWKFYQWLHPSIVSTLACLWHLSAVLFLNTLYVLVA